MKPVEIKDFRKSKKMSMEALGLLCGVTKATVSRWEKGERNPSGAALIQLDRVMKGEVIPVELSDLELKLLDENVKHGKFKNREDYLTASLKHLIQFGDFMPITPANVTSISKAIYTLPLTAAAAGSPITTDLADELPTTRDYGNGYFAVQAFGESMHPVIPNGSVALIMKRDQWKNPHLKKGQIYTFTVNGEQTIKRYATRPATDTELKLGSPYIYISSTSGQPSVKILESINPDFPEIIIENGDVVATGWFEKLL